MKKGIIMMLENAYLNFDFVSYNDNYAISTGNCYKNYEYKIRRFIMYVINDSCISCGACEAECPVNAISAGDSIYVISADCIDCGACANVCPVDAPQPE